MILFFVAHINELHKTKTGVFKNHQQNILLSYFYLYKNKIINSKNTNKFKMKGQKNEKRKNKRKKI